MSTILSSIQAYDVALLLVVTGQAALVAYLPTPAMKAWAITVPLPFTLASLSLGIQVDGSHLIGMWLLFGFTLAVWYLHARRRWPILPVIVGCAVAYCLLATTILGVIGPATRELLWWPLAILVAAAGMRLFERLPRANEPAHRSPVPLWLKVPILLLVVSMLIALKHQLQGAMTLFPMVGVIACYEARHSLWTQVRQIPVIMVSILGMLTGMRAAAAAGLGLVAGLAVGWLIYAIIILLLHRQRSAVDARIAAEAADAA